MIERTRLPLRALLAEATAGVLQRPGRAALTMLGTVLGIGAFVAIIGLTATARGQINEQFSLLEATQVVVRDVAVAEGGASGLSFPDDTDARLARLNGVVDGGVHWRVLDAPKVSNRPPATPGDGIAVPVYAASPGMLRAAEPALRSGVLFETFHRTRREDVAVLGAAAARQLGITRLDARPAVFVGDTAYTVVGIVDDVRRAPALLLGVVIPDTVALRRYGPPQPAAAANALVRTDLGAAELVARQAPVALRPDEPQRLAATTSARPKRLEGLVLGDLDALLLLLAGVATVVGMFGIANTTLVSILERTGEIGLRRALGARPRHIALQFVTESTVLGVVGGLLGASLGVVTVLAVSVVKDWTALLDPVAVLPAPLAGAVVGLLAGAYPALRAAAIEPVEALRR